MKLTHQNYPYTHFCNGIPPNKLFSQSLLQLFQIFEEKSAYKPIHCKNYKYKNYYILPSHNSLKTSLISHTSFFWFSVSEFHTLDREHVYQCYNNMIWFSQNFFKVLLTFCNKDITWHNKHISFNRSPIQTHQLL